MQSTSSVVLFGAAHEATQRNSTDSNRDKINKQNQMAMTRNIDTDQNGTQQQKALNKGNIPE